MSEEINSCFNTSDIDLGNGRIHVPVAKVCKMQCKYCNYIEDKNVSVINRPGVSEFVLSTEKEIRDYIDSKCTEFPDIDIIGVSGPGDPLDNIGTLEIINRIMNEKFPDKHLCVCSCGYNYLNIKNRLFNLNKLKYFTITINTLTSSKMGKLYKSVESDIFKAEDLINQQIELIKELRSRNINVKINTIFIPTINDEEIINMFKKLSEYNVNCFNLLPLRNINDFIKIDNKIYIEEYKNMIKKIKHSNIPLINKCSQCKSNACGKI